MKPANDNAGSDPAEVDAQPGDDPRAFVTATGFVFQSLGALMLLGSCTIWLSTGLLVSPLRESPSSWRAYLAPDVMPYTCLAAGLVVSVLGAMALAATGIGMQGEKNSSGRFAVAVAACLMLAYTTLAVVTAFVAGRWLASLVPAAMGVVSLVLLALASRSAAILRAHPTSSDHHVVSDAWLEEHRRKKMEQRGM